MSMVKNFLAVQTANDGVLLELRRTAFSLEVKKLSIKN